MGFTKESYIKKCKVCGKEIDFHKYLIENYVYKTTRKGKIIFFCGWNCQMKYERSKK